MNQRLFGSRLFAHAKAQQGSPQIHVLLQVKERAVNHIVKHKKVYKGIAYSFIMLLLLFFAVRIYSQYHITVSQELVISANPSPAYVQTTRNTSVLLHINTSAIIPVQCSFTCNYSLEGAKQPYALTSTQHEITHIFDIQTPTYGQGQQYNYLRANCAITPTAFCPATNTVYNHTTLIVIDYTLTQEEQEILTQKELYEQKLQLASQYLNNTKLLQELISRYPIRSQIAQPSYSPLELTHIQQQIADGYILAGIEKLNELFAQEQLPDRLVEIEYAIGSQLQSMSIYNEKQREIARLLSNQTLLEYLRYSSQFELHYATDIIAFNRLSTLQKQAYWQDTNRSVFIANGALSHLHTQLESYEQNKIQTKKELEIIQPALLRMNSSIPINQYILSLDTQDLNHTLQVNQTMCDVFTQLAELNAIAISQNKTIVSLQELLIAPLPLNDSITILFSIPQWCIVPLGSEEPRHVVINTTASVERSVPLLSTQAVLTLPIIPPKDMCCINTQCHVCSQQQSPIIFIHGHAFDEQNDPAASMESFSHLQQKFESKGYINAGAYTTALDTITIKDPFTIRASYYFVKEYGLAKSTFTLQQSERIENYAIRLRDIIQDVKTIAQSSHVVVIAHSMGGLVAREYESLFGATDVEQFITINTPHQGTVGRTAALCTWFGAQKECTDMKQNSTFFSRLSQPKGTWNVIASRGCDMGGSDGDGVVLLENSKLPLATSYVILNGTCTDSLQTNLHTVLLEDPRVYTLLESYITHKPLRENINATVQVTNTTTINS